MSRLTGRALPKITTMITPNSYFNLAAEDPPLSLLWAPPFLRNNTHTLTGFPAEGVGRVSMHYSTWQSFAIAPRPP